MLPTDLVHCDLRHNFHPCSQMKDYETFQPLVVTKVQGSYLILHDGRKIIDANASWWCKLLGHNHPRLKKALLEQADQFEHVIFANTTNKTIASLSEKLAHLTDSLDKVFYASDGASAVEIAIKMSLHARKIRGELKKTKFIALANGYHGETCGALSVSDLGIYKNAYAPILFDVHFISPLPYVSNIKEPLWFDCAAQWKAIEDSLMPYAETTTAIVLEPIIQGASGMHLYSQDFLKRLRAWARQHNIHFIADEIMTGLGRTGTLLACEHANIEPDFLCLAKALTGGWMPMSAVLMKNDIYQLFYDDYPTGKSFLHSHTYSGNTLAARIALEVLNIIEETHLCQQAIILGQWMAEAMQEIAQQTAKITNIRHIGAIVAADLICNDPHRRLGFEVYQKAVALGALLRPIGNTIYWLPPLNTEAETIEELKNITKRAILAVNF